MYHGRFERFCLSVVDYIKHKKIFGAYSTNIYLSVEYIPLEKMENLEIDFFLLFILPYGKTLDL